MKDDPIIAEIRRVRHELSAKFGHDPRQLVKYFQELEKQHVERMQSPATTQLNPTTFLVGKKGNGLITVFYGLGLAR